MNMNKFFKNTIATILMVSSSLCLSSELSKTINEVKGNQTSGKESQAKVDALYEQKRDALYKMRSAQAEIDQLEVYNRQLREIITNQDNQIISLEKQISEIEITQQGIMPLMERMLNGLEQFILLDIPFLLEEREQRIASLRSLLLAADVTVSEKFRRVLEAYQIEIEYGRTIESYRGANQEGITVDFLRIGRSALLNVTLDESQAQSWDINNKKWSDLDSSYIREIKKGVSIAKKQAAPSLLELPLQKSEGIQ